MERTVPIDSITVNRALEPGDDISELAEHIDGSGLQVPLLVNQNFELIDGLRRLAALRSLGITAVHVVPVTMFGPATTWIERARQHGILARPLSPRRIWHLYTMCLPLISMSRSHEMKGKPKGKGVHVNGRGRFIEVTGIRGEAYLQASLQIYRSAQEQGVRGDLARQAVELLERGDLSVYGAVDWVKRRYNEGNITSAEDQLTLLQNAAHAFNGIAYGLGRMAPLSTDITRAQLEPILREFRNFRRRLYQLIHTLESEKDS